MCSMSCMWVWRAVWASCVRFRPQWQLLTGSMYRRPPRFALSAGLPGRGSPGARKAPRLHLGLWLTEPLGFCDTRCHRYRLSGWISTEFVDKTPGRAAPLDVSAPSHSSPAYSLLGWDHTAGQSLMVKLSVHTQKRKWCL